MVAAAVITIGCLIAWFVLEQRASSDDGKVSAEQAALLAPQNSGPHAVAITSTLGVTIPFNGHELAGFGLADGTTYAGGDLREPRAYSVMRIRPVGTSEAVRNQLSLPSPELRVTTSLASEYWQKIQNDNDMKGLAKADILIRQTINQRRKDNDKIAVSDVESRTINKVQYRKVSFTDTNETHNLKTTAREDCYVTVQNDRPYVACIHGIRTSNFAVAGQLEAVLGGIGYQQPQKSAFTAGDITGDEMLSSKGDAEVSPDDTKKTEQDAAKTKQQAKTARTNAAASSRQAMEQIAQPVTRTRDFAALAKTMPSVVRFATIYCANIKLNLPNRQTGTTLTGACDDRGGSAFYVSNDGLLATAASNTTIKPRDAITAYITKAENSSQAQSRLRRVLDYMVEAQYITRTDADDITSGVQSGDASKIDKVHALSSKLNPDNITVEKESYAYAVQLGDKPIVINRTGDGAMKFAYSDTVVAAKKRHSALSLDKTQQDIYGGATDIEDVALIALDKSTGQPALPVSAATVTKDSELLMAGLPQYAGTGVNGGQLSVAPLYRLGKVQSVADGKGSLKIAAVAMPSHNGLTGAPVVNQSGGVVGMGTYNTLQCPDKSCFAGAAIYSANGILSLAKDRNITLNTKSTVRETWSKAVDELIAGNYRAAEGLFQRSQALDRFNIYAPGFAEYAKKMMGSERDTSTVNTILQVLMIVVIVSLVAIVLLAIWLLATKLFARPARPAHYSDNTAATQYNTDPSVWGAPAQPQYGQPGQSVPPAADYYGSPQPAQPQPGQYDGPYQPSPAPYNYGGYGQLGQVSSQPPAYTPQGQQHQVSPQPGGYPQQPPTSQPPDYRQ